MGLRNQKTSFLHFTRTATGLRGEVTLPNGAKMDCTTWASKAEVVSIAQTICRANMAFGRLVISPNTFQQEVIKI